MRSFQIFTDWVTKNFSNIFSVLGILLTLYFGIWYVPSWLKEAQNERLKNAQQELQQSIKELAFSDSSFINIDELTVLVRAKELTLRKSYPYTLSDILTKTQESFMEDKFLRLSKRKEMIQELEMLKQKLPNENEIANEKKEESRIPGIWGWLSTILSILIATLGVIVSYKKYQVDKSREEEINNVLQEASVEQNETQGSAYEYEKALKIILKNYPGVAIIDSNKLEPGMDIEFAYNNKIFFVEVKYLRRSKVGLKTIYQFLYSISDKSGEAWFVYNTELTLLAKGKIEDFNQQKRGVIIKTMRVTTANEFQNQLPNFLI